MEGHRQIPTRSTPFGLKTMICLRDYLAIINNTTTKQTSTNTLYQTISQTKYQHQQIWDHSHSLFFSSVCFPFWPQWEMRISLRKAPFLPRVFCKALEPECGYFRSLEEKERYMRGLKSQCQTNPRNWKCEFYKEELSQIRSKRL